MNPTHRIEAARKLYLGGDWVGARRACEAVLIAPTDAQEATDARLVLIECARRAGDRQTGMVHARAAVDATPEHALAHYALAFAKCEFDHPRVQTVFRCPLVSGSFGLDGCERNYTAFGLGDDFVLEHEDVIASEPCFLMPQGCAEFLQKIVAR